LDRYDHYYGRRIETDGSWTVYHVFTGATADVGSGPMAGLSKIDATTRMISLNAHNAKRRKAATRKLDADFLPIRSYATREQTRISDSREPKRKAVQTELGMLGLTRPKAPANW
jgi:hypothetical protein